MTRRTLAVRYLAALLVVGTVSAVIFLGLSWAPNPMDDQTGVVFKYFEDDFVRPLPKGVRVVDVKRSAVVAPEGGWVNRRTVVTTLAFPSGMSGIDWFRGRARALYGRTVVCRHLVCQAPVRRIARFPNWDITAGAESFSPTGAGMATMEISTLAEAVG